MNTNLKPETEERPIMIICGIIVLYALIIGFILYLFLLHRISQTSAILSGIIFTGIYIPRFLIFNKLKQKDNVKIFDDYLTVNNFGISLSEIQDYRIKKHKPEIIFFLNNKMIVYQEAEFHIKTNSEQITFNIIGSKKIELLTEFLDNLINTK